jgi:anti-anti-sigma regulatory factor
MMKKTSLPGLRTGSARGFAVLRLPAEIGWDTYPALREAVCAALTSAPASGRAGLVVDFGDSALPDASGLVLLARTHTRAHLLGRVLRAVVPPGATHVRDVLDVTGLSRLVPLYPDLESATCAPPPRVRRRPPFPADGPRVMDAIRALYPRDSRLSPHRPDADLTITTVPVPDDEHVLVRLAGVLDEVTVSRLGETLTAMIEEKHTHHLRVRMHDRIRVRCDPFPVLLGIRWRAHAEGGCLTLANLPARLRQIIDREGLRSAFQPCRLMTAAPALSPVR